MNLWRNDVESWMPPDVLEKYHALEEEAARNAEKPTKGKCKKGKSLSKGTKKERGNACERAGRTEARAEV